MTVDETGVDETVVDKTGVDELGINPMNDELDFCIIGLTKIPKIEFLPLDWVYRSIRIMTV